MSKTALTPDSKVTDRAIRRQLDRVIASPTFQQVDRLKRFLSFVVQESVEGRSDQLKEYVIGVQVFGKEESFDPRTDPIVRVQARRLRARLERYDHEEGQNDELVIELPKGGYAPVFRPRDPRVAPKRSIGAALASRNTVAVLPFADHSAGADLAYFCHGLRQEIIHSLAKFPTLRVLAWSDTLAKSSDAAMIITGSVRRSGDTARVAIQLVDGGSGCYLWSESINANMSDVLSAQEEVSRTVVTRLQPDLLGSGNAVLT